MTTQEVNANDKGRFYDIASRGTSAAMTLTLPTSEVLSSMHILPQNIAPEVSIVAGLGLVALGAITEAHHRRINAKMPEKTVNLLGNRMLGTDAGFMFAGSALTAGIETGKLLMSNDTKQAIVYGLVTALSVGLSALQARRAFKANRQLVS